MGARCDMMGIVRQDMAASSFFVRYLTTEDADKSGTRGCTQRARVEHQSCCCYVLPDLVADNLVDGAGSLRL
jgi:hypothetical protein